MYGWRGRIGLLVPSINTTMETEFWHMAPEGVSVHTARIAGGRHGTPEELRNMEKEARLAAERIANVEPDVVVYGCTSGSFFEGPEWNRMICEELTKITGAPTVTTAGAMAECMTRNSHRKVDVVTPYVELTNERLKQFLRGFGVEVGTLATFDMLDMFDHAKIQPEEIYRRVKETTTPDSSAVFVACTQLRALEVLDLLERDLGKPVYSAIQATAWLTYEAMKVDPKIENCGSLLQSLGDNETNRISSIRKTV
ncbi:maleate cis-trans isomerase family protein [Lutibaculum baratangense]|uniref:Arylmalonate decarboxylase n=1 Tax=Lutibaculum baratangense AMV1 TaxID=631454 RepID=V4REJ0_9HYPH|nr:aspartate/glutamate racemase family protein [Lutibaculum baratangense]ESR23804.1 arylmalonate decarboxylase [Lutibaculum baratangense AMV1]